ncbi:MAG: hypothetical protein WAU45_18860 [Blastocatellia bacterium]
MPKRPSKSDPSLFAKNVLDHIISKYDPEAVESVFVADSASEKPAKNPAAVALGKLGGSKGGRARAASLSPRKRKQIAKKAAKARWSK